MIEALAIHVGFSRTGTTTLQKGLFARHSQVRYLGKPYADGAWPRLLQDLVGVDSVRYDPAPLQRLVAEQQLHQPRFPHRLTLLSEEVLLSYSKARDKGLVAQRLHQAFAPCRILFTIRNQFELLKSAYLSRGRFLHGVPPRFANRHVDFSEWLALSLEQAERSYIAHADFHPAVDCYARLFGRERVCVLPLELLAADPGAYLDQLCGFLGIDAGEALRLVAGQHEHRDLSAAEFESGRLYSAFSPLSRLPGIRGCLRGYARLRFGPDRPAAGRLEFRPEWRGQLADRYRPGNRALQAEFGLDLGRYGYPL